MQTLKKVLLSAGIGPKQLDKLFATKRRIRRSDLKRLTQPYPIRRGNIRDLPQLRETLMNMDFLGGRVTAQGTFRGSVTSSTFTKNGMDDKIGPALAALLTAHPSRLIDLRYTQSETDGVTHLQVSFVHLRTWSGLWGVHKRHLTDYVVDVSGKVLPNAMHPVRVASPKYRKILERAILHYKVGCFNHEIFPHKSKVHSFGDTVAQIKGAARVGKSADEIYNIATQIPLSHLFDDHIDPVQEITTQLRNFNGRYNWLEDHFKSTSVGEVMEWMRLLAKEERRSGVERLILLMVFGALIQNSKTFDSQKKWMLRFRDFILEPLGRSRLAKDVAVLHPALLSLTMHTGTEGFLCLEEGTDIVSLPVINNLFYAPLFYCHDRVREHEDEHFNFLYGKEICEGPYVPDTQLFKLLDVFEAHTGLPDSRRRLRVKQMRSLHRSAECFLSKALYARYAQAIRAYEKAA